MYKILAITLFSACVAMAVQHNYKTDSSQASILAESRFLDGAGANGAEYSQDDGIQFMERTDANGNRVGSYSYIDPTGQRRTVSYTAGENGFQPMGNHLPKAPVPAPMPAPMAVPAPAAAASYPAYNVAQNSYVPSVQQRYDNRVDDGQYHPELYQPTAHVPSRAAYTPQQAVYTPQQAAYPAMPPMAPMSPQMYPQMYTTTPVPIRRHDQPGHMTVERKPDGYVYSFNTL